MPERSAPTHDSLRALLPAMIAVSEGATSWDVDALLPTEASYVRAAVTSRRRQFATGRHRARDALGMLGYPDADRIPVAVGHARQPIWPTPVVGSISHCAEHCAAAVAWADDVAALGIDVEEHRPLEPEVVEVTCFEDEFLDLPSDAGVFWPAVLFSAREALFKAWYPTEQVWLDHHDVSIRLDPHARRFTVRFLHGVRRDRADRYANLIGAFGWSATHIYATAWLPSNR